MRSAAFKISVLVMFAASTVFAAQPGMTGNDYLKMSKPQRVKTVRMFKEEAAKQGVTIKKDPVFYCEKLDAFYAKNPDMKSEQFVRVVKTLAIMEYDWAQSGVDRDALAKQWLGNDLYSANKARIGARR